MLGKITDCNARQIQSDTYAGWSSQTLNQEAHGACSVTYDVDSLVVSGITQIRTIHLNNQYFTSHNQQHHDVSILHISLTPSM